MCVTLKIEKLKGMHYFVQSIHTSTILMSQAID